MHDTKLTKIQLEVRENTAHNAKVTNIQLEVIENSAHNTKGIKFNFKSKKTVQITLK